MLSFLIKKSNKSQGELLFTVHTLLLANGYIFEGFLVKKLTCRLGRCRVCDFLFHLEKTVFKHICAIFLFGLAVERIL